MPPASSETDECEASATEGVAATSNRKPPLRIFDLALIQWETRLEISPLLFRLFGIEQSNLKPHAPGRRIRRMHSISIELCCDVDRL